MISGGIAPKPGSWLESLNVLFPILKKLPGRLPWAIGGGAALEIQLGHRPARDLDLCFRSVEALEILSPTTNPEMRLIAREWREHGHFTKLVTDSGQVDLVLTRDLTGTERGAATMGHAMISLESPAEVIARKVAHRGGHIRPVDVFDLVVAGERSKRVGEGLKKVDEEKLAAAARKVAEMATAWGSGNQYRMPGGEGMMPDVSSKALAMLDDALRAREGAARQREKGGLEID